MLALIFGKSLGVDPNSIQSLQSVALIAIGAVFGSAVSVNGWKQPLVAAHTRLDNLEKEVAVTTAAVGLNTDNIATNTSQIAAGAATTANIASK